MSDWSEDESTHRYHKTQINRAERGFLPGGIIQQGGGVSSGSRPDDPPTPKRARVQAMGAWEDELFQNITISGFGVELGDDDIEAEHEAIVDIITSMREALITMFDTWRRPCTQDETNAMLIIGLYL